MPSILPPPLYGRPFLKRFALCYQTVVCLSCPVLSVCNIGVLWPNGWTDQDETWHAGRPRPWHIALDGDPALPPQRGAEPPIFGPYLLRPNGCRDKDGTWYRGRIRPRRLCVRWRPSSLFPQKGAEPPIFGHIVAKRLDGSKSGTWHGGGPRSRPHCARWRPASLLKKGQSPIFLAHVYYGQTAGWLMMPLGTEANLVPGDVMLDGGHSSP